MSCVDPTFRSVQYGYSKQTLKKYKTLRDNSKIKMLDWITIRKDLNNLGFSDKEILKAIHNAFKTITKKPFNDDNYLFWVTSTEAFKDYKPKLKPLEQISGKFSQAVEIVFYSGCWKKTKWEKQGDFIEYRIPNSSHYESILRELLYNKFQAWRKYDNRKTRKGLGYLYLDKDNIKKTHFEFRTIKGDITLNLWDLLSNQLQINDLIQKEINDYKEWNKDQMKLNDKELKEYLVNRGFIYVYNGKSHEKKDLIKKYIPTVNEQKKEWQDHIKNMAAKYKVKDFLKFLEVVKNV